MWKHRNKTSEHIGTSHEQTRPTAQEKYQKPKT